jgi:hypothetical protein
VVKPGRGDPLRHVRKIDMYGSVLVSSPLRLTSMITYAWLLSSLLHTHHECTGVPVNGHIFTPIDSPSCFLLPPSSADSLFIPPSFSFRCPAWYHLRCLKLPKNYGKQHDGYQVRDINSQM